MSLFKGLYYVLATHRVRRQVDFDARARHRPRALDDKSAPFFDVSPRSRSNTVTTRRGIAIFRVRRRSNDGAHRAEIRRHDAARTIISSVREHGDDIGIRRVNIRAPQLPRAQVLIRGRRSLGGNAHIEHALVELQVRRERLALAIVNARHVVYDRVETPSYRQSPVTHHHSKRANRAIVDARTSFRRALPVSVRLRLRLAGGFPVRLLRRRLRLGVRRPRAPAVRLRVRFLCINVHIRARRQSPRSARASNPSRASRV